MALHRIFQLTSVLRSAVSLTLRRNIGISAVLFNRAKELDPVQKLFLDKIRDYNSKSKSVQEPRIDRRSESRSMALTMAASSCKKNLLLSPGLQAASWTQGPPTRRAFLRRSPNYRDSTEEETSSSSPTSNSQVTFFRQNISIFRYYTDLGLLMHRGAFFKGESDSA